MSSNPYLSLDKLSRDPVAEYLHTTGAGLHLFDAARANKLPATLHHLHLVSLICNGDVTRRALVAREIEYACRVLQLKSVAYFPHTLQKGQVIDRFEFWENPSNLDSLSIAEAFRSYNTLRLISWRVVALNPRFFKEYLKIKLGQILLLIKAIAQYWFFLIKKILPKKPRRAAHTVNVDYWIIHRDHARRYFQTVQWTPEEGSPLWCWLRGTSERKRGKLKPEQQDKADFQQLCMEHWQVSPTTLIRGEQGVVALVGNAYLRTESRTTGYTLDTLERWASEVAPTEVKARRGRPPKKTPADQ
ncbi:hypothetical protein [Allochromatium vinosum]|uniref:hypothetical protein n=1 Tax=Allochromatium vinosum TaxID=1049 RepID=UPI001903A516|nr:hypothetical protein [Allochromatium vinosum]